MIVCLSPSASHLEETTNTLKFASRAANICNRPVANVRLTPIANIPLMAIGINARPFNSAGVAELVSPPNIPKYHVNESPFTRQANSIRDNEENRSVFHDLEQTDGDGDEVFRSDLEFIIKSFHSAIAFLFPIDYVLQQVNGNY